jgi:uncharacterized membrane protein YecN with MAPEG domain
LDGQASLAHSALFAGYYSYLSANVIVNRLNTNIYLGSTDSDKVYGPGQKKTNHPADVAKLQRAVRAHANFSESAPFAFFLIFLAELNGAPTSLVHAAYTTLFAARVAHANIGIQAENSAAIGRPIGAIVTLAVTIGAGVYNVSPRIPPQSRCPASTSYSHFHFCFVASSQLNLGWEPLKSFLGFK